MRGSAPCDSSSRTTCTWSFSTASCSGLQHTSRVQQASKASIKYRLLLSTTGGNCGNCGNYSASRENDQSILTPSSRRVLCRSVCVCVLCRSVRVLCRSVRVRVLCRSVCVRVLVDLCVRVPDAVQGAAIDVSAVKNQMTCHSDATFDATLVKRRVSSVVSRIDVIFAAT